jgi:hypothetical protein
MIAFLAGLCLKGDHTICPAGSTVIPAEYALSVGFLVVALIGLFWLGYRSKR